MIENDRKPGYEIEDTKGTKWSIVLDHAALARVKHTTGAGVDLLKVVSKKKTFHTTFSRLLKSPAEMAGIVFCVCEDQINRLGMSPEEFGTRLGTAALFDAWRHICAQLQEKASKPTIRAMLKTMFDSVAPA